MIGLKVSSRRINRGRRQSGQEAPWPPAFCLPGGDPGQHGLAEGRSWAEGVRWDRMGVAIELILVFLAFCWVAGKGVPWTLLFVPAYLGLLTLKITPVGRKIKCNRVFMDVLHCLFLSRSE